MNSIVTVGHLDRAKYIGGSAIAPILGVSPWKTALDLYQEMVCEKVEVVDEKKERFFKRRKRQEPVTAEMLADDYGYDVARLSTDADPNRYMDENGIFAAEIDFELRMNEYLRRDHPALAHIPDGTLLNGEIKTVHPLAAADFGPDGSDEIPVYYTSQALWGLGIKTDRPACLLVAMIGFDDIRMYPILRDDETIAWMRQLATDFWYQHVVPRIPPPPTTLEDAKKMFLRFNGRPVDLDESAFEAFRTINDCRATIREAEKAKDDAETRLALAIAKAWMAPGPDSIVDDAVLRYYGQDIGTWKLTRGAYLDQKQLKFDDPDLVDKYMVSHFYRVVRAKKQK